MWLATQHGFYSIVQKPPGQFHVRARVKQDLDNLIALAGMDTKLYHTPDGDYAWRIVVGQSEVDQIMAVLSRSIEYSNFKSRIHELEGQRDKLPAYSNLWGKMLRVQAKAETNKS
jgi:hypothetical protein